jgi:hypothetical protein
MEAYHGFVKTLYIEPLCLTCIVVSYTESLEAYSGVEEALSIAKEALSRAKEGHPRALELILDS